MRRRPCSPCSGPGRVEGPPRRRLAPPPSCRCRRASRSRPSPSEGRRHQRRPCAARRSSRDETHRCEPRSRFIETTRPRPCSIAPIRACRRRPRSRRRLDDHPDSGGADDGRVPAGTAREDDRARRLATARPALLRSPRPGRGVDRRARREPARRRVRRRGAPQRARAQERRRDLRVRERPRRLGPLPQRARAGIPAAERARGQPGPHRREAVLRAARHPHAPVRRRLVEGGARPAVARIGLPVYIKTRRFGI